MKVVLVIAMVVASLAVCAGEKRPARSAPDGILMQPPVTAKEMAVLRQQRAALLNALKLPAPCPEYPADDDPQLAEACPYPVTTSTFCALNE
jgi:hypothetical protein